VQTIEGDLIVIETASRLSNSAEFPDAAAVVFRGELHQVSEDTDLQLGAETLFDPLVQKAFQEYCESISNLDLYHSKVLFIPAPLKRLLLYDPSLISAVIRGASFATSLKFTTTQFVDHRVTFRKFHFAFLDSLEIRVPRTFGERCPEKPFRYIKLSFQLTVGFENLVKAGKIREEIESSMLPVFDHLMTQTESQGDDDEDWLDSIAKPEFNFDQIGAEMAERMASYVSEISEFDAVDADGPVNFDIDSFTDKLEHFLDSSESEEEDEEDAELLDQLDDEQLLRSDRRDCVQELLGQSFNAQPDRLGPTADLMGLFRLAPDDQ
jgi:hypothetical protein